MPFDILSACYALSVTAGGIVGYVKAGSTSSLFAGLTFGSILGYGAYQTSVDEKNIFLSFATASVLGFVMGMRFWSSGKFMPAGLVAAMSFAMVMRFASQYIVRQKMLN